MTKLRPALAAVLMLIVPCAWTYEPPEADWNAIGLNAEKQSATYWLQRSPELDTLFETLKTAKTRPEAARIAREIQRIWSQSGSDTADLLMERADEAIAEEEFPLAIEILDRLVVLQPDWAEAWNRRATVFFLTDDYRRSVADIGEVLRLEPRHYGAIAGLGLIYRSMGDDKRAFKAFEQALEIYPQNDSVRESLEELRPSAEGLDL